MENDTNKSNSIALRGQSNATSLSVIKTAEDFEKIVNYVANSEIYNIGFMVNTQDDNGKSIRRVDRNAIATCLMLGSELGFKPLESIMLGRRLDDKSIIKAHRGRDLGLSPMASLQNIYVWEKGGKETVYTGIHIIYKALTDAGVKRKIIDDGTKPFFFYVDMKTNEELEFDSERHIPVNTGLPPVEIEAALKSNKVAVIRKSTRRGLVELYRTDTDETIAIPYTLVQAVDAGLYAGTDRFGNKVDGKDNWNKHPAAHLIKMSVMNGARILIGDKLNGQIYIPEELPLIEDTSAQIVD